ncbi:MAG TPA: cell division/cell wall cluster transcriptional repressor MraZ, partial [Thermodesulfobacteriota bacterium]|nr:cell division/cell wall cluster transcriptional repressor MraZ [Thermodesulfobacteriota bacterium]
MFRGRFEHTIDAKGRLSIPVKFRDVLSETYDTRLVVTTYDGCLMAYP